MWRYMVLIVMCLGISTPAQAMQVERLPIDENGWNGGDAAYSRLLPDGQRLWIFGDSLVGGVTEGRREKAEMFRNAVGVQDSDGHMAYYWGEEEQGVFTNPREGEWYWPADFLLQGKQGVFFLRRMIATDAEDTLGFRVQGTDIVYVQDVTVPPRDWEMQMLAIRAEGMTYGVAAAVGKDGYVYLLVNQDDDHRFHLARIAEKSLREQLLAFTHYDSRRRQWQGALPARPWLDTGAPEASLHWHADAEKEGGKAGQWRLVYSRTGLSPDIVMRHAAELTGAWSDEEVLYHCPEMQVAQPDIICYAGKEVPDAARFQITYSTNSLAIEDLEANADLYIPRIVTP